MGWDYAYGRILLSIINATLPFYPEWLFDWVFAQCLNLIHLNPFCSLLHSKDLRLLHRLVRAISGEGGVYGGVKGEGRRFRASGVIRE